MIPKIFLSAVAALFLTQADAHPASEKPFLDSELIFPLESWHNHGSCIVEAPNGDLLVCWFHGSGERTADDVVIEGARLRKGRKQWSQRYLLADTPAFPDGNPCMFIDDQQRLWLFHTVILANTWESALIKYRVSSDYLKNRAPRWERDSVLHVKPGPEFEKAVAETLPRLEAEIGKLSLDEKTKKEAEEFLDAIKTRSTDKLYRRLGWMTRAHPVITSKGRLIVPLYHDGFSFCLMAFTDNWGETWGTSAPLIGAGNIQAAVVERNDGTLYTLMRDNGPPPKRLMEASSSDHGVTWSQVVDSDHANSGTGSDIVRLRNGNWVLINNDTERGRHQLAVSLSEDEGRTWKWKRYLEQDRPGPEAGSFHYPSIIQGKDGTIHASYSYHLNKSSAVGGLDGSQGTKSIKHAHFNEAWIRQP